MEPNELQRAFTAELQRLLYNGLTPEEELIARRYYSDKERKSMDESSFCGPHRSFPVTSQADVTNAAHLVGHAENPEAVKKCIIGKAKAHGWSLPKAWEEDGKEDRAADGTLNRAANHEPMTGKHSHAHPAYGAQGEDASHEHEHSHDGDNQHDHAHAEERAAAGGAIQASDRPTMYAPFLRVDATKREVIGQATAEVPDSYGTIFGYYPKAFELWRGNIREQHDPKKAVGKRVDFFAHDDSKSVDLLSRVSRGAQDTWLKVEDNVLTGYSLSVIPDEEFGFDTKKWPKKEYNGKLYPYLPRYSIAEVSLVDNPACPGCNIQIVRADGFATDVLDLEEAETTPPPLERAGARLSADTMAGMHESIGHTLKAAYAQMKNCGCPECQEAMKELDPDGDGDIDAFGGLYGDTDGDAKSLYGDEMDRSMAAALERILPGAIERLLGPAYSRLQGIAGTLARTAPASALDSVIEGALSRALEAAKEATTQATSDLRADLSTLKRTVDKIADTPIPGAPVQNAGAAPRPVEKSLPTDPYPRPQRSGSAVADALAQMSEAGLLDTPEKQANAVAAGFLAQRQGR